MINEGGEGMHRFLLLSGSSRLSTVFTNQIVCYGDFFAKNF